MTTTTTTPIDIRPIDPVHLWETDPRMRQLGGMDWREVAKGNPSLEFEPHLDRYRALQQLDALIAFGAFRRDLLVGYATALVFPHLHAMNALVCQCDALFVDPEWRGSSSGARLIASVEIEARSRGCIRMSWHAAPGEALERILNKRRDYWMQEVVYTKEL